MEADLSCAKKTDRQDEANYHIPQFWERDQI